MQVKIGDDRLKAPIAVLVDDIAAITVGQQLLVEPRVGRPWPRVWSDSNLSTCFGIVVAHGVLVIHAFNLVVRAIG